MNISFIKRLVVIIIFVLIIKTFFLQLGIVHGDSMYPTLKNNQIIIINKYENVLKKNDIVVINKNGNIIIKRLIGIPGDNIKIDKYVYVNEKKIDNNIIDDEGYYNFISLNNDEYYVLGDNRNNSIDSRFKEIGIIKKSEIIGIVIR